MPRAIGKRATDRVTLELFADTLRVRFIDPEPGCDWSNIQVVRWYDMYLHDVWDDPWDWYIRFMRSVLTVSDICDGI